MTARKTRRDNSSRRRHFLAAWLRSPLKIGAVVPSSQALARAMAAQVDTHVPGAIIELGAGTGAMTHALIETGLNPARMLVVERDKRLHALLVLLFPELDVVCADAAALAKVLEERKIGRVNAVVSSLPLRSMAKNIRKSIIQRVLEVIAEHEGVLIQFTYGARSPIPRDALKKMNIAGKRVRTVMGNVPPAHVWVYRKIS